MNNGNEFLNLKNYEKGVNLGHGTFGDVFKVKDKRTGVIYAAKISRNPLIEEDKSTILNIKREVNMNAQLNHPCILKFIGYSPTNFTEEPNPVIITELALNDTLEKCIQLERQSLSPNSWNDTKKLINIYGIASAMAYLHSNEIMHRDLKPANILEDDYLFPKICDFGLSKNFHQNAESMSTQSTLGMKGTPIYIPPESWETNQYSKSGDVYAFGLIVYELMTLEKPFQGFTITMLYSRVVSNGYRPDFKYEIPDCYQQLIKKCWSQNPDERPTFEDIVNELKNNHDFITNSVEEDEFLDYVDLIDNYKTTFDPTKKFKKITFSKDAEKVSEIESKPEKVSEIETSPEKVSEIETSSEKVLEIESRSEKVQKIFESLKLSFCESTPSKEEEEDEPDLILTANYKRNSEDDNSDDDDIKEPDYDTIPKDELNLNSSVNVIYDRAFMNRDSLRYVVIPSFITQIGMSSFENCTKLVRVDLPSSVTKIDNFAFQGCIGLMRINIPSTVTQIGMSAFSECDRLKYVTLPPSLKKIPTNLFNGCKYIKEIVIPPLVSEIGMNSFRNCYRLKKINIPSSVTRISNTAFEGCCDLLMISIPSSVKQIGNLAFCGCSSLKEVTFEKNSNLSQIGKQCFSRCSSLEVVLIPSSVKQIGEYVFSDCSSLKKVNIPTSIKTIGEFTFSNCSSLNEVRFDKPSSLEKIDKNAFENCKLLTSFEIPSSVVRIENNCFLNCESLKNISIGSPSKLSYIEYYIVSGCTSLTQLKLPPSIKQIKDKAFISSSLKQLLVPESIKNIIKKDAFANDNIEVNYY